MAKDCVERVIIRIEQNILPHIAVGCHIEKERRVAGEISGQWTATGSLRSTEMY